MKHVIFQISFLLTIIIITVSCTKIQDTITTPKAGGIHGEGVLDKASPNFHGGYLVDSKFSDCQQCHAGDFSGGTAGVSCSSVVCHPAISVHSFRPAGSDSVYPNVHGEFVRESGWDMESCRICHGTDYSGGISSPSCRTCHVNPDGPEACNTCHGDFADLQKIAPPRGLLGETATDKSAVGAHQSHLSDNELRTAIPCSECHVVPEKFDSPGHIDNSTPHATLVFGTLATNNGANPSYDFQTLNCSSVYCHGNFKFSKDSSSFTFIYTDSLITGNKFQSQWNKLDDTQAECGTCHALPPIGHQNEGNDPGATTCSGCHSGVVGPDGTIIDSTKHINGKINVFGS